MIDADNERASDGDGGGGSGRRDGGAAGDQIGDDYVLSPSLPLTFTHSIHLSL